jgi:acyl dehydratase
VSRVQDWHGVAFNQATASENKIHADDVAKRYGFRGGLVPGVTVYAYLAHPALVAWERDWLERGAASVELVKPLYDEDRFEVRTSDAADDAYEASVVDSSGVVCATGRAWMPADEVSPPVRRGDARTPRADDRPPATREVLERLREAGLGALYWDWDPTAELGRYVRTLDDVPDLVRPDREALANPAFTLGLANFVLAANVRLGPWIHVASEVRHFSVVPRGGRVVVEARVTDLFEKRGHEFVDLDVAVFVEPDRPVLSGHHRAIYRLREG